MSHSRIQYSVIFAFGIALGLLSGIFGLEADDMAMGPVDFSIMYIYGSVLLVYLGSLAWWGRFARYLLYALSWLCLVIFVATMILIIVDGAHFGDMVLDIGEERQRLYHHLTAVSEVLWTASMGFMGAALIPLWWARWRKPRERP